MLKMDGVGLNLQTGVVVRIHDTPRTALFSPDSTDACPEKLSGVRVTNLTDRDGSTQTIQHSWGDGQNKNVKTEWIGKTVFILNEKVTEQDQTNQHAISFLAERMTDTSKSGKRKATAKQFNYSKEPDWIKEGINKSRLEEWRKWMRFTAIRPIEEEELQKLLQGGHTPNRYAVDRHRQEFAP